MRQEVARRYKFRGEHSLPGLEPPWCDLHEHLYTVEVVAAADIEVPGVLVLDTDELDRAWDVAFPQKRNGLVNLNKVFGASFTSVEALSSLWLRLIRQTCPPVVRVTVWEDDERWGSAEE
jgi:6-pyruvoyl-tetrahydropterin synthase